MVGKYSALSHFLSCASEKRVVLSFSEIENILRFTLPRSAYVYRPWWANDSTHVQARDGWLNSGWRVDSVDFEDGKAIFRKSEDAGSNLMSGEIPPVNDVKSSGDFEKYARKCLSDYFGVELKSGQCRGVPKLFDFVSDDGKIVGDAKYFTLVKGRALPPAKFSVIAEHVWLLEKTNVEKKFLVFGNDKRVPIRWLEKYGDLFSNIDFYFIDDKGKIELLNRSED